MKSFFIETYGCQMNKADSSIISQNLTKYGFSRVNNNDADIIIINTCSVRKTAENRIWGRLGYYKGIKKKRDVLLVIVGCMAQRIGMDFINKTDVVDIVIGTFFRDKISEILLNHKKGTRYVFTDEKEIGFADSIPDIDNPDKAFVTISYGCNNFCSYCIVPYLRGREHSRPSNEIINDINQLTDRGVKQVTLLGQNVNSYGFDNKDISFPGLLKKIASHTDIKWIKYLTSHPKDFTDELIDVIANEDKVSNWLHLAVQAGSNKILNLMNRKYKIEEYINRVEKLKKIVPKLNLTTDIIVGFPGESDKDYQDTINLIKRIRFDDAYMYKYNSRENTVAALKLEDDVKEDDKTARLSYIIDLQRKISRENKLKRIGDEFEVICESWSKKDNKKILGVTKEELMIVFEGDNKDFNKINKIKSTKLEGSTLFGVKKY